MTSKTITLTTSAGKAERFPEFPPRDDMRNWLYLYDPALLTALAIFFSNLPDTTVASEVPVGPTLDNWEDLRIPDLIVAHGCDLELLKEQRGYAIDRQGKPPVFVLEVASVTTGIIDYTKKRRDYERYGIPEYWRFDPTGGRYHDEALAGDHLMGGRYHRIEIEWIDENCCRGYSEALGLYVCWEHERLRFYDPISESNLHTHEEEAAARRSETTRADQAEAELRRLRERLNALGDVE